MTGLVAEIWRHPIKACGREALAGVTLREGRTMPWDRRWAIAHEASKFDPAHPAWTPCASFTRTVKAPGMQAISAHSDVARGTVTLSHPERADLTIDPDDEADGGKLIQWILPFVPAGRALPARLVRAPDRGMTDSDFPSISLVNLASHREVERRIGRRLSPTRWRANLILDGLPAWAERGWTGKRLRVGAAELEVRENIARCLTTATSTRTGRRDADTLGALEAGWGHREFGVYAVVTKTGMVEQGDGVEVIG